MEIRGQLDPNYLLTALNGKRRFGSELKAVRVAAVAMKTQPWAPLPSDDRYDEASTAFAVRLRELIDEWIESGRDADGGQSPRSRRLENAPSVDGAMRDWLVHNRPFMSPQPGGGLRGAYGIAGIPIQGRPSEDPVADAREEAVRLFVMLYDSAFLYRIARCERCRGYFFWRKPKATYKRSRGPFCRGCLKSAGEERKRADEREEMRKAAARALCAWRKLTDDTKKRYDNDERAYVVAKLKRYGIQKKWVTRNEEAIGALIEMDPDWAKREAAKQKRRK